MLTHDWLCLFFIYCYRWTGKTFVFWAPMISNNSPMFQNNLLPFLKGLQDYLFNKIFGTNFMKF